MRIGAFLAVLTGCQDSNPDYSAAKPALGPAPTGPLIGQPPRPEHRADLNCDVKVNARDLHIILELIAREGMNIGPYLDLNEHGYTPCQVDARANMDPLDLTFECVCCDGVMLRLRQHTVRDYALWQREASRGWQ